MKDTFKVVQYEFHKILKNKVKIIYLFLMILFLFLAAYAYRNVIILPNVTCGSESTQTYYIEQRDYYKALYEYAYGINTDVPEGFMFPPNLDADKEIYHMEYLKYNHYVSTSTSSCNYVNLTYPLSSSRGLEGGVFLVILGNLNFYIIGFLSIVLSLSINYSDYSNGNIKNLIQTKIDRKSIFRGKLIFTGITILSVVLLYTIATILVASSLPDTSTLIVDTTTGVVKSISTTTFFLSKIVMNLFIGLFIASISIYIRTLVKNSYLAGFATIGCVVFVLGIFNVVSLIINNDVVSEIVKKYFVFINSQVSNLSFGQISYAILILFYLVGSTLFILMSNKKIIVLDI